MERESYSFQTISEFLEHPFGNNPGKKKEEYLTKYRRLRQKIKVSGYTILPKEESVLIHVNVPSESKKDYSYDVVLQFFAKDKSLKKEKNYLNYFMRFFSNAPSFIYTYAALYYKHGFLIDTMVEKLDPAYANKMPSIRNKDMEMFYDSTIFMACNYLFEHKLRFLTKYGMLLTVKKLHKDFFKGLRDFKTTEFDLKRFSTERQLRRLEEKLDTSIGTKREVVNAVKEAKKSKGVTQAKRITGASTRKAKITPHVKRIH